MRPPPIAMKAALSGRRLTRPIAPASTAVSAPRRGAGRPHRSRCPVMNSATSSGCSCVPAAARSRDRASDSGRALRYGPGGGHRAERVGDRDDPRDERDRLAREAVDVASAVPSLVVVADAGPDELGVRNAADDRLSERDVLVEHAELVVGQLRRLAQHDVRDADLADVVEQAGELDRPLRLLVEARCAGRGRRHSARRPRSAASCSGPSCRRRGRGPAARRRSRRRPAPPRRPAATRTLSPPLALASVSATVAADRSSVLGPGVLRIGADADADTDRQQLGPVEFDPDLLEAMPEPMRQPLHVRDTLARAARRGTRPGRSARRPRRDPRG